MLYEDFAILYADMLLGHYLKLKYQSMPDNEVFQILQRAWFWGPTIYRKGPGKIGPRERMAAEYLNNTINGAISCKSTQGN